MNSSSLPADSILINTEALNSISSKTKMFHEKLEGLMNYLLQVGNGLTSSSAGRFSVSFQRRTAEFTKALKDQIDALNQVELQAAETLKQNTELDEQIATGMK